MFERVHRSNARDLEAHRWDRLMKDWEEERNQPPVIMPFRIEQRRLHLGEPVNW